MNLELNRDAQGRVKVTTSLVVSLLKDHGMTREEIAETLELTMADVKRIFQHPKLKGLKTAKKPMFVLEDDLDDEVLAEIVADEEVTGTEDVFETIAEAVNPVVLTSDEDDHSNDVAVSNTNSWNN
jgi:predicted transcriptional regulator